MKVITINTHQLNLLTSKFHIIEGHGLVQNGENLIQEGKIPEYRVSLFVQGQPCEIRIGAYSSSSALSIARTLFPKATVTGSATLIR